MLLASLAFALLSDGVLSTSGLEAWGALDDFVLSDFDSCVVVDALLGTGLTGDVRDPFREAIEYINASGQPVLAIDIPSGLCSDTGRRLGVSVQADATITFIGIKQGLLTGDAPDFVGELHYADLDVPTAVFDTVSGASSQLVLEDHVSAVLGTSS